MQNNDDIWNGGSIKKSDEHKDFHYDATIQSMVASYNDDSAFKTFAMMAFMILGLMVLVYLSVCGPAMWHNSLVVCNGSNCTTYTDWKVISEDHNTGVLEVWAGGRLQRLSNGTWHYE